MNYRGINKMNETIPEWSRGILLKKKKKEADAVNNEKYPEGYSL